MTPILPTLSRIFFLHPVWQVFPRYIPVFNRARVKYLYIICLLFGLQAGAQPELPDPGQVPASSINPGMAMEVSADPSAGAKRKKKLNFFVVSKRKKGALDLATRFNVFRTKLKSLFRRKKFVAIVARNGEAASAKIRYRLEKFDARIGTLWFDSHGMYKKGYSLFFIGQDEISYKTLQDSGMRKPFGELVPYSDEESMIIIGACYGGATYHRSSIDYRDTTRMNGDSLMMALGQLFDRSRIYACESWVMTKPGLFLKREAVAGFPGRKLFLDQCYRPAWENVGKWNEYNAATRQIMAVNPVTLDRYGNALLRTFPYAEKPDVKKDIARSLSRLEPGLYK